MNNYYYFCWPQHKQVPHIRLLFLSFLVLSLSVYLWLSVMFDEWLRSFVATTPHFFASTVHPQWISIRSIPSRKWLFITTYSIALAERSMPLLHVCLSVTASAFFMVALALHCESLYVTNIFAGQWIDDQWTIFAYGHTVIIFLLLSLSSAFHDMPLFISLINKCESMFPSPFSLFLAASLLCRSIASMRYIWILIELNKCSVIGFSVYKMHE